MVAGGVGGGGRERAAVGAGLGRGVRREGGGERWGGGVGRQGGGRQPRTGIERGGQNDLDGLVEPETRGDPMARLRWTPKSTRNLADELGRQGHQGSHHSVGKLLAGPL